MRKRQLLEIAKVIEYIKKSNKKKIHYTELIHVLGVGVTTANQRAMMIARLFPDKFDYYSGWLIYKN